MQGFNDSVSPTQQGAYSGIVSFTTAGASLLAAPNLSGPANGATGVSTNPTFSWSSVAGATKYWVTVATSSSTLPTDPNALNCPNCVIDCNVTTTSYTAGSTCPQGRGPALASGTTYFWRVQGYNNTVTPTRQGQFSSVFSFSTAALRPPAPTLSSPGNGAAGVSTVPTFSWSAVTSNGATGSYRIQVATNTADLSSDPDSAACGANCVVNTTTSTTSFTPASALAAPVSYVWQVHALGTNFGGVWSSRFGFTTAGSVLPGPPTPLAPGAAAEPGLAISTTTPTFQWSGVSGADGYGLYISQRDSGGNYNLIFDSEARFGGPIGGSSLVLPGGVLTNSNQYRWNMRSHSSAGWGTNFSGRLFFTVNTGTPSGPTITSTPPSGPQQTTTFTVGGSGFSPGGQVRQFQTFPNQATPQEISSITADGQGKLSYQYQTGCKDIAGVYVLSMLDVKTNRQSNSVTQTVTATSGCNPPTITVSPQSGAQGASFSITGSKFTPNGQVRRFAVFPNGVTFELTGTVANGSGQINISVPTDCNTAVGSYTTYMLDVGSNTQSTRASHQVTANTSCSSAASLQADPESGPLGTVFRFTGRGFTQNSTTTLSVTKPGAGSVTVGRYSTDSNGVSSFLITSQSNDPTGQWNFVLTDDSNSSRKASKSVTYMASQTGTDVLSFIADITYQDNAQVAAGLPFKKTWRLQNAGTATWNNYIAVFVPSPNNGNPSTNLQANGVTSVPVQTASPGQNIDLSIDMKAPASPGTYYSYWQLQNTGGTRFGVQFYVKIRVVAKQGNALGFGTQSGRSGTNDAPASKFATNADPVNTATGNYNYTATDLRTPGRGLDVELSRSYNSQDGTVGPLGRGWSHSFDIYLANITSANVSVHYSDGKVLDYLNQAGTNIFTSSYPGFYDKLVRNADGTWSLNKSDQRTYLFDSSGKLTSIRDRNNNQISMSYSGGNLSQVTDTVGRIFSFNYEGPRLKNITDPAGRNLQFGYDASSNLISFRDANGNTNTYSYDAGGQLTKVIDGRGNNLVVNTYGGNCPAGILSCVATQSNGRGNQWTFVYNPDGSTSVFDPLNKESKYLQDVNFNIQQTQDRNANTQFASGAVNILYDQSNNRAQVSDPKNNYVAYVYDENGNVTGRTDPTLNSRQAVFDSKNNPTQVVDEMGKQTQMAYDGNGNLTELTDALDNSSSMTYDQFGQLLTSADANGNITTQTYDAQGNLISVKDALNNTTTYTYDAVGRRVNMTDARGNITKYTYNQNDNLLTVTDPLGGVTTYTYDANNNRTSVRDARGNTTTYSYDENNLLVKETDAKGSFVQHTYDKLDRRASTRDKRGNVTTFTYDNEGRLLTTTDPLGNKTSYTYDANGNRTQITDAKNQTTSFSYDALNRVTRIQDVLGNTIQKGYDAAGRLRKETDPRGNATQFDYDAAGNLLQVNDAAAGTAKYSYDKNRNRITQTDPNSHTSTLAYDKLNRLLSSKDPLDNTYSYTYDGVGNRTTQTDAKGRTIRYGYDAGNRLTTVSYPDNSTVQLTYDANGNITKMVDSLGTTNYTYDELNRVTSYSDPYGKNIAYQYDANGNITKLTYPDGKQISYQYDANDRLSSLTDWSNKTTSYEYDSTNLLTKVTYPNGITTTLTYDNAGRLTAKSDSGISSYSFTLDRNGNRTAASVTQPLGTRLQNTSRSYTYDASNRIQTATPTTFGFDANGNMTSKVEAGVPTTYGYDFENRLVSVGGGSSQYSYNGQGVRLQKLEGAKTTRYVVDINHDLSQILCETDANGAITAYYVYGVGLTYKVTPDGTHYYYHYDAVGSTVAMTDDAKNVVNSYAYDPFGKVTNSVEGTSNSFKFIGQYGVMQETGGLLFMRARYYMPDTGRFMHKDPIMGSLTDTQVLSLYIYAGNKPTGNIDPSGLSFWGDLTHDVMNFTSNSVMAAANAFVVSGATIGKGTVESISTLGDLAFGKRFRAVDTTAAFLGEVQSGAAYNLLGNVAQIGGISVSDDERWDMSRQVTRVTDLSYTVLSIYDFVRSAPQTVREIGQLQNTINVNSFLTQAGYGTRSNLAPILKQLGLIGESLHGAAETGLSITDIIELLGRKPRK